jgi:hypothetical protein
VTQSTSFPVASSLLPRSVVFTAVLALLLSLAPASTSSFAQTYTGGLRGTVTDASGHANR